MTPARAVYRASEVLVDWLSVNLLPTQESTFRYFRQIMHLVRIVEAAERGEVPKFAALSAIRAYNQDNGTSFTYKDILDKDDSFLFSDACEWIVFSDNSDAILLGQYDDAEEALTYAPAGVSLIIAWDTSEDDIFVYRSPRVEAREILGEVRGTIYAKGMRPRHVPLPENTCVPTYVLPAEIEAALGE